MWGLLQSLSHVASSSLLSISSSMFGCQFHQRLYAKLYMRRSQKCKKLLELTVFLALLGSACIKAARKMLVKLTPDDDIPTERERERKNFIQFQTFLFLRTFSQF